MSGNQSGMSMGGLGNCSTPRSRRNSAYAVEIGGERAGVAHHHLEERDAVGAGDEGPEGVTLVERDVRAGRAVHVTAGHVAPDHEDHVIAVVAVRLHDHPRVPLREQRQEVG